MDKYHLPRPNDLFTCLTGGKVFTKLDLIAAYQQMFLDEPSSKLVTINTIKGLFTYTQLPFGGLCTSDVPKDDGNHLAGHATCYMMTFWSLVKQKLSILRI